MSMSVWGGGLHRRVGERWLGHGGKKLVMGEQEIEGRDINLESKAISIGPHAAHPL